MASEFWSDKPHRPQKFHAVCDFTPQKLAYVLEDQYASEASNGIYTLVVMANDGHVYSCHSERPFSTNQDDAYEVNTDEMFMTPWRVSTHKDISKQLLKHLS